MAKLPAPPVSISDMIYQAYEKAQSPTPRAHLGASLIGEECTRRLWYGFRWVQPVKFPGRVLRLFERGQNEEAVLVRNLRSIGITVHERDEDTGKQFTVSAHGGHFGGSLDGIALNIPEAPKTWHVLEFKTHGKKSFEELSKKGVQAAQPKHYAQMQVYMRLKKLERALYVAVCKDNDEIHTERIHLDKEFADGLIEKAGRIINAQNPPAGISDDPAWYQCKFCDFHQQCFQMTDAMPHLNCRTCAHSTPEQHKGKHAPWYCVIHEDFIPVEFQWQGCERHCYIPKLLPWPVVDSTDSGIIYQTAPDLTIENGPGGHESKVMYQAGRAFWEHPVGPAALNVFPSATIEEVKYESKD